MKLMLTTASDGTATAADLTPQRLPGAAGPP